MTNTDDCDQCLLYKKTDQPACEIFGGTTPFQVNLYINNNKVDYRENTTERHFTVDVNSTHHLAFLNCSVMDSDTRFPVEASAQLYEIRKNVSVFFCTFS